MFNYGRDSLCCPNIDCGAHGILFDTPVFEVKKSKYQKPQEHQQQTMEDTKPLPYAQAGGKLI
jgi:hypothetical protein